MSGDFAAWRLGFDLLQFVVMGAVGVHLYLGKKEQVSSERIQTMETHIDERLDDHDRRLTKVEAACKHAPGHGDLGKVYKRVNGMSNQVAGLVTGQEALQNSVNMIHEHLLGQSGGK